MTDYLPREDVVSSFRALADEYEAAPSSIDSLVGRLPPYLCQRLALNESFDFDASLEYAYVGEDRPELHVVDGVESDHSIAVVEGDDIGSLTARLPLDGHRQATNRPYLLEQTVDALERMATLEPERLRAIEAWTSLIVWLELTPGAPVTALTSSTFPAVPHCSFLTEKALRHIPPNSVAEDVTDYALRENLYHEALHQKLGATLLHRDVLEPSYSATSSEKVPIPWRESFWEPDRALHAAVVYTGLIEMREDELDRDVPDDHREWLEGSTTAARDSLTHLIGELDDRENLFTSDGAALFETIHDGAMEALAA